MSRLMDAAALWAAAEPLLCVEEALHARLLGTLGQMADDGQDDADLFLVHDGDRVIGVAVRTSPWPLQLSAMSAAAAAVVARHLKEEGARLDAVLGPVTAADAFAATWATTTCTARIGMSVRTFACMRVEPPSPIAGRMRSATGADRELLARWLRAFHDEAVPDDPPVDAERVVDRWLAAPPERGGFWVWDDDGPLAMAGTTGATPHGIRILAVYTPPPHRCRGVASNLVAAVTQAELDRGRDLVFLATDLSNPTSNRIYTSIGYEPVGDQRVIHFDSR